MPDHGEMKQKAKAQAAEIAAEARDAVHHKAADAVSGVQSAAAEKVQQASSAASSAASHFDPQSMQAEATRQVADQFEWVANQIRTADLDTIVRETSGFARRNPLLFIGAAAAVGFVATRFLKAQSPQRAYYSGSADDPWSSDNDGMFDDGRTDGAYNAR